MVTATPVIDPLATLWTSPHVVPGRWVLESNAGETGGAYRWLLELMFGTTDGPAHRAAERALARAEIGRRQLFCHFGPVIFNVRDISPFKPAGFLFRFPILHVDRPPRGEILRAYVESIAFAIRGNCEQIEAGSGRSIPRLTVSGGMTRSPTLVRILADILGIPVAVAAVPESASLGCAILAAIGVGAYGSLAEAVAAMTRTRTIEPEASRASDYGDRYRKWRELYDALQTWTI
jgi:sugar (pentulose or hexulose) kinase